MPFALRRGAISLPTKPGLGYELPLSELEPFRMDRDCRDLTAQLGCRQADLACCWRWHIQAVFPS